MKLLASSASTSSPLKSANLADTTGTLNKVPASEQRAFIQVALAVPLAREFDYWVNSQLLASYKVGCRVKVPFGKKTLLGIVVGHKQEIDYDTSKIKPVDSLIDKHAIFDKARFELAKWLSRFYIHPLGEVLAVMNPKLIRTGKPATPSPIDYITKNHKSESAQTPEIGRSKKQQLLFQTLQNAPLLLSAAKKEYSAAAVKGLLDKTLAIIEPQIPAKNTWQKSIVLGSKKRANPEQAIAVASINQAQSYTSFLLEGVTGSGKTEVYLQVIEEVLLRGMQVLILVPEIGLTPQTVRRFEQRFGNIVSVWHSALTDNERLTVWQQAANNQTGIVIGTRSAVFLPLANVGMIIVDEEHDESFKQQDSLRYHARDVAAYRAKQFDVPLVLGTATPSLESLHNALANKYRHLTLTQRAGSATMPSQHLMDLTSLPLQAGIAPSMLLRIEQQLTAGSQVLIYVNRRGYAPALICQQCGHVETCIDCNNPFTLHLSTNNLQCHRCGQFQPYVHKCKQCQSQNISTQGIGTEQIQHLLAQRFPEYSCVRIDSDSTRGKRKLNDLLTEIGQNKHQILVGTQILSKGHHFPNVTLALILNVDSFLFSADYRAPEKLAQLVTQLSGRAGRADKTGEVWLQSFQIGHPLLQDLVNNGYSHFSRSLLQDRVAAKLPPVEWQIALRVEHAEQALIFEFMQYANQLLVQFKQIKFIGPFPAAIEKKQGRYRYITVAQSPSSNYLNKAMWQVYEALNKHALQAKLRWSIDVMPTDFS